MENGDWVQMKFDPQQMVNVRSLISVMRGEIATLSKDQWEDTKECCADVMEQFLEMRREAEKLDSNLRYYFSMYGDLMEDYIQKNGREAYVAFQAAREQQGE
jgi:hypothetical protein